MEAIEKIRAFLSGSGSGSGDGDGSGDGSGDGYGYGSGYGYGYGSGSGSGDGSGDGYGSGSGDGDSIKINTLNSEAVFYVDEIPTIINKIIGNIAKGRMINIYDFTTTNCFISKVNGFFAHGETARKAFADAEYKYLQSRSAEEHIERIKSQGYMTANDYRLLTGACEMGTSGWLKANGYTWEDKKPIREVIKLTVGSYGHDTLVRLLRGKEK